MGGKGMKGGLRGEKNVDRGPSKGERGRRGTLEGRKGIKAEY